jgi:hypothetical protein
LTDSIFCFIDRVIYLYMSERPIQSQNTQESAHKNLCRWFFSTLSHLNSMEYCEFSLIESDVKFDVIVLANPSGYLGLCVTLIYEGINLKFDIRIFADGKIQNISDFAGDAFCIELFLNQLKLETPKLFSPLANFHAGITSGVRNDLSNRVNGTMDA